MIVGADKGSIRLFRWEVSGFLLLECTMSKSLVRCLIVNMSDFKEIWAQI